jgi:predicted transcriptional regulator
MTATTTAERGHDLRASRESLGITRAQLAGLADCSLAQLTAIEQGAVPRRSAVLERAWAALDNAESLHNDHEPAANGLVGKVADGDRQLQA